MLFGALTGLGLLLLTADRFESRARSPAAELARIDAVRRRARARTPITVDRRQAGEPVALRRLGGRLGSSLEGMGIRTPVAIRGDLAMVGRSLEAHLGLTLLAAAIGALTPTVVVSVLVVVFPGMGATAVAGALLVGALVGALLPTITLTSRASGRRRDFRHVVGSFLDLVAMNLAGGRGVPEALQSASRISDGWAMVRIRDALEMARLQGATPWAALGQLGAEMRVEELRDMASALALVADDGAKVRDSLSARAASLRRRELADIEGRAQARSQSMLVAQLLLAVGFLIFLTYPALARVLA